MKRALDYELLSTVGKVTNKNGKIGQIDPHHSATRTTRGKLFHGRLNERLAYFVDAFQSHGT